MRRAAPTYDASPTSSSRSSRGSTAAARATGPSSLERELDRLDAETPNLRAALEFARDVW